GRGLVPRAVGLRRLLAAAWCLAAKPRYSGRNLPSCILRKQVVADCVERNVDAHRNTEDQTPRHVRNESLRLVDMLARSVKIREPTHERRYGRAWARPIQEQVLLTEFRAPVVRDRPRGRRL